jgi:type VI secretion system protein ImpH
MADDGGIAPHGLSGSDSAGDAAPRPSGWAARLRKLGAAGDLFQLLRRLEAAHPYAPRIGRAARLAQDMVRLGQEPSLAFARGEVASVSAADGGGPTRIQVNSFGMLGPNGPLPLHVTEYVWQRLKHHADRTLASFLDLFHHRMLSFMYRAWADANPAVAHDRPEQDRFSVYLGALFGVGTPALRERDLLGDDCKRYYAGRFVDPVANPEGLEALIEAHFGLRAQVEEFVGEWVEVPSSSQWRLCDLALGSAATSGRLGLSTTLGREVYLVQERFRVVLGPLTRREFQRVAPGGEALPALVALVRSYAGDQLRWDLRLELQPEAVPGLELGVAVLGQTAWLWSDGDAPQDDLVFDPQRPSA